MSVLRAVLAEVFGLFVDDGFLALAILAIVALTAGLPGLLGLSSSVQGALLFLGCSAVLVESVLRAARRKA
jgi:hypothetical protein